MGGHWGASVSGWKVRKDCTEGGVTSTPRPKEHSGIGQRREAGKDVPGRRKSKMKASDVSKKLQVGNLKAQCLVTNSTLKGGVASDGSAWGKGN